MKMPDVRLIDANSLKPEMEILNAADMYLVCHIIDNTPTIEAEPVRHGRWIPVDGEPYAKCSYCGEKHYGCTTPYCDMCGTYMREVSEDANQSKQNPND